MRVRFRQPNGQGVEHIVDYATGRKWCEAGFADCVDGSWSTEEGATMVDYENRDSGSSGSISRDTFSEFRRRCDERHDRMEGALTRIQESLDAMILRIDSRVDRIETLERTLWWQRGILILCCLLVSMHPIAQVLPILRYAISGGHP